MGEGDSEVEPVSIGVGSHGRLYQYIDGGDKGVGAEGLERLNKGLFLFGTWFLLKKAAEAAIYIGAYLIGIFKNNNKLFARL